MPETVSDGVLNRTIELISKIDIEDQRLRPPLQEQDVYQMHKKCTRDKGHHWITLWRWYAFHEGKAAYKTFDDIPDTAGDYVCAHCNEFRVNCYSHVKLKSSLGVRGVISNHEFVALFLAVKGPVMREDVIEALRMFRNVDATSSSATYGRSFVTPTGHSSEYFDSKGIRWCGLSESRVDSYWKMSKLPKQKGIRGTKYGPLVLTSRGWVLAGKAAAKAVKVLGLT